ncbi:short-chain dehydrogenases/reductase [Aspergillus heteromorphus CBS 117.55]|uniref:Short-chain dehydrogenases/reductase n=1 Tax=Aspergillus heteromorphus CBS 117.55 TaxID=1448321 RepID=A0A317WL84_9EURO|nr:short-chain dehydrogenases/reductase [Aspergillus heteromorphus CBS 117.55]PWY86765.1 short-chain dehydrogenases/reductase [Aspergillus heteromorphus CBS 117.55]
MIALPDIQSSNARITTSLSEGSVALFVGGTSGVGEITLKQFASHTKRPRIYFVGRSQEAGTRIATECKTMNPEGEYIFIPADASLIRVVDEVSRGAGGHEGQIDTTDLEARKASIPFYRGHITSMTTLALEHLAEQAPTVSFINVHPGIVKSGVLRETDNLRMWVVWIVLLLLGRWVYVPEAESAERHLFLLTSAMYPASHGEDAEVSVPEGMSVARGADGSRGSGVYSMLWTGESPDNAVQALAGLRAHGIGEVVWRYTESQFKRITGVESI